MDVAAVTLLILYLLVKDVVIPLVKKTTSKKEKATPMHDTCPHAEDAAARAVQPIAAKIPVLEFNLQTHETRLTEFSELIKENHAQAERTATALDNKLDIVLAELKEFREAIIDRVSRVETHIEHLLQKSPRRGSGND